eukprot:9524032-Karenia_brevis.AAC.1
MAPVKTRAGKDRKGDTRLASVVAGRIHSAWRGDWGTLWRDAAASRRRGAALASREKALEEEARTVEAYLKDGLVAKAVATARGVVNALVDSGAAAALGLLFPAGELPDASAHVQG